MVDCYHLRFFAGVNVFQRLRTTIHRSAQNVGESIRVASNPFRTVTRATQNPNFGIVPGVIK